MNKKFYITTAIDYTDDVIHIGHIYQKIIADVLARYHRLLGETVFFLTGTDEHGGKVEKAAAAAGFAGKEKEFVDLIAQKDLEQQKSLNISFNRFIRTTDEDHVKFSITFWQKIQNNGDIYSANYEGIYCDGCEAFLGKTDLVNNKCPYHPNKEPRLVKEKNYFFRWSKYSNFLKNHILTHPDFIWPESRKNEMLAFLDRGIQDIPISRPKIKWGIPVPNDPNQTIYVWFDALINYLSGVPKGFWPADIHVLGKDNTRWHALLWPAMLKSAGYELPKTILVNGFITLNGQKISKSLGNIIRPSELAEKFGADASRYFLLRCKPVEADGDISLEKIKEVYNADLANGLGNLVARVAKLCETSEFTLDPTSTGKLKIKRTVSKNLDKFNFGRALEYIWKSDIKWGLKWLDQSINEDKPWEIQNEELLNLKLHLYVENLLDIAFNLKPFLPETAEKIKKQFSGKIKFGSPLFPRI